MRRHSQHHSEPEIGHWYDAADFPDCFSVVDIDRDEAVEIQYLDGELDKLDMDTWHQIDPEEIPEPEDATAPYGVEHDQDVVKLLREIEDQKDLDEHIHNIDSDEEEWQ